MRDPMTSCRNAMRELWPHSHVVGSLIILWLLDLKSELEPIFKFSSDTQTIQLSGRWCRLRRVANTTRLPKRKSILGAMNLAAILLRIGRSLDFRSPGSIFSISCRSTLSEIGDPSMDPSCIRLPFFGFQSFKAHNSEDSTTWLSETVTEGRGINGSLGIPWIIPEPMQSLD